MENYSHTDLYSRKRQTFTVEVSRHTVKEDSENRWGKNRWCVYIYIYKQHPLWEYLNNDKTENPIWIYNLPGHGDISYYKVWKDDTLDVTSYQLGWDYAHEWDMNYSHYDTAEEANSVFLDAQRLYEVLNKSDVISYLQNGDLHD